MKKPALLAFAGLTLLCVPPAHAYVDPSAGALFWQFLMAAAFGGLFYLKALLRFAKDILKKFSRQAKK